MEQKRYTRQQAERLIARLVSMSESPTHRDATVRKLLNDLLQGRFGEIAMDDAVVGRFRGASDSDVRRWAESVRNTLRVWVTTPGAGLVMPPDLVMIHVPASLELVIQVSTGVAEALRLQLAIALRLIGRERLRRCDCGRLFVRIGKRQFCSERCQKRVYMRLFRAGLAGKE